MLQISEANVRHNYNYFRSKLNPDKNFLVMIKGIRIDMVELHWFDGSNLDDCFHKLLSLINLYAFNFEQFLDCYTFI